MHARPLLLLAFFTAASFALAGGGEPVEHKNGDGKYTVVFPGKPKLAEIKGRGDLAVHVSSLDGANWGLTVNYYDLPVDLPKKDEFVKKGLLNEARGIFVLGKGEMKTYKYTKLQKEHDAIECTGTITTPYEAQVRVRSVIVGKRIYNVVVLGSADFVKGESAQKFFDSFKITK